MNELQDDDERELEEAVVNGRMCIVSRRSMPADRLIRFVAGPDGRPVPDLRRRLPGRGAHVEARRDVVETAVKRRLLSRALKRDAGNLDTLAAELDTLLLRQVTGALGLGRKAGVIVSGASKVEAALRARQVQALLHASEAAEDGLRKLRNADHAASDGGRLGRVPSYGLLTAAELGLAFGGEPVVHAAVLGGEAGKALVGRLEALRLYRTINTDASDRPAKGAEP